MEENIKRFPPFAILILLPAFAFSQRSELTIDALGLTVYPAFGNPDESATGILFAIGVDYVYFFSDIFAAGIGAGAGFLSPEEVYPNTGGFVIFFNGEAEADFPRGEVLSLLALARAGVMLSFYNIYTDPVVNGTYFRGDISAGVRFTHFPARVLLGVETIDFRNIGFRLELGFFFTF